MSSNRKIAIFEVGGSHDECILSQVKALKEHGVVTCFCGTKEIYERNSAFKSHFDNFYEVQLNKGSFGDFKEIRNTAKWLKKEGYTDVVCNTAQGGHVRNLSLVLYSQIKMWGIIHTTKMLEESFTQKIISRRIHGYFLLNQTLVDRVKGSEKLKVHPFYPLDYSHFNKTIDKPQNEVWLTTIGGVENRRKDLIGLLEFLKELPENYKVIFLGKSNLELDEVNDFLNQIESNGQKEKVVCFHDFVEEEEFDAYLKATDLILPLVHPNTNSATEYFNRQISGAINVAFSYSIPMLIHEAYTHWEDFQSGVVFYKENSFHQQLEKAILHREELVKLMQETERFQPEYWRKEYAKVILGNENDGK